MSLISTKSDMQLLPRKSNRHNADSWQQKNYLQPVRRNAPVENRVLALRIEYKLSLDSCHHAAVTVSSLQTYILQGKHIKMQRIYLKIS